MLEDILLTMRGNMNITEVPLGISPPAFLIATVHLRAEVVIGQTHADGGNICIVKYLN